MEWLSNAWEWVSGHADTAVSAVSDFLNTKNRISVDERNALINSKYLDAINLSLNAISDPKTGEQEKSLGTQCNKKQTAQGRQP